jgi:hypothetical protein
MIAPRFAGSSVTPYTVFPGSLQPQVSRLFVFILFPVNLLQAD